MEEFVIVRACVGCVLPTAAKLIGSGEMDFLSNGIYTPTNKVRFYDYEISNDDVERFVKNNEEALRENKLMK